MSYKNFATATYKSDVEVPAAGTFTIPYPAGTDQSKFGSGDPEQAVVYVGSNRGQGSDFVSFAYGASDITVTNETDVPWPADIDLLLQMPKNPLVTGSAEASLEKSDAVIGAGMAIAPLAALTGSDPAADIPLIVTKVNELIAAYQAS